MYAQFEDAPRPGYIIHNCLLSASSPRAKHSGIITPRRERTGRRSAHSFVPGAACAALSHALLSVHSCHGNSPQSVLWSLKH